MYYTHNRKRHYQSVHYIRLWNHSNVFPTPRNVSSSQLLTFYTQANSFKHDCIHALNHTNYTFLSQIQSSVLYTHIWCRCFQHVIRIATLQHMFTTRHNIFPNNSPLIITTRKIITSKEKISQIKLVNLLNSWLKNP